MSVGIFLEITEEVRSALNVEGTIHVVQGPREKTKNGKLSTKHKDSILLCLFVSSQFHEPK